MLRVAEDYDKLAELAVVCKPRWSALILDRDSLSEPRHAR
jgi:hypothetical protein